ncbi:CDI toxin immunity protein [Paenibacillus durus]|uniref:Uncharacterized protein n=1 Tax=Paenibacillus durus TaxID=44251 RepID=A0A089IZB0_PAEDU|nr:hypothetical protein [Paenibacillus durus]AIQ14294.1 hypothetical protein PDUR_22095 [Paenibacillus durus]
MDAKSRKAKLQLLLERQKLKAQKKGTSSFFDECMEALGEGTVIFSNEKTEEIYTAFQNEYQITFFGRIDWTKYEFEEIDLKTLETLYLMKDEEGYVLWSHGFDPVIQAKMNKIIENINEVTAVSPDVWLYKENNYVIEIFHDGIIRKMIKSKD